MTAQPSASPIDFEDPKAVRRFARIIAFAILAGAAAFAAFVNTVPAGDPGAADPREHRLHDPFVIIAAGLVLIATTIGTRMYRIQGTPSERHRKTLVAHIASLALSEAAAFLGLVLVFITHSWEVVLPAALGFAGLVTCAIRGEVRFSGLIEEADRASGESVG